ncbi:2,5-didehydrogluconate reductase [Reticulomyxa filosa]|uniref:2,5-didehydrogluconate reductase n=1 Tax=Reticulomyxa filosa TaxID=46433 RepID=X6M7N4_RETFI|nr:2,5-didehydrogluconate reductase [Reticulomyxa filosa]|eukprot:ETO09993.1 2,5-didehydrogluconate reductase [Reticulomyxa filosa]
MEQLYFEGKVKVLAVSNYDVPEVQELLSYARVKPAFIQNKYDIFTQGGQAPWVPSILQFAQENNIRVQGYCGLNSWPHQLAAVNNAHVKWVAAKYRKTPAQTILRWAFQQGVTMLTRSESTEHQLESLDIFDFTINDLDMQLLNAQITLFSPYFVPWMHDMFRCLFVFLLFFPFSSLKFFSLMSFVLLIGLCWRLCFLVFQLFKKFFLKTKKYQKFRIKLKNLFLKVKQKISYPKIRVLHHFLFALLWFHFLLSFHH